MQRREGSSKARNHIWETDVHYLYCYSLKHAFILVFIVDSKMQGQKLIILFPFRKVGEKI